MKIFIIGTPGFLELFMMLKLAKTRDKVDGEDNINKHSVDQLKYEWEERIWVPEIVKR